jgi:S-adenosylmethionine decarboxylase
MEATGCSYEKLTDMKLLTNLLNELPTKMNMTKIMEPHVFEYKGGQEPDDWGLSGIVIIAESHLAFHTFPDKGFLTVDIFSCKDFDVKQAVEEIVKVFEPEAWDQQLIQRGREFPRSMTRAKLVLDNERTQMGQLAFAS